VTNVLDAADLYHTGIVVPDINAMRDQLTEVAGYRWTDPLSGELPVLSADGEWVLHARYMYSLDPPHIELVQEIPGTPWTAAPNVATHHLGYWCDDVESTSQRLEQAGFPREACGFIDGRPSVFAYHLHPTVLRIEIVERSLNPDWDGFLRSKAATK
jgi:hypothetical protein